MTPKNVHLCISGVDGTGKTSLIEGLRTCEEIFSDPPEVRWMRFHHFLGKGVNGIGRLCRLSYSEKHEDGTVVGYHEYYRSFMLSLLYIAATSLDALCAWIFKVWIPLWLRKRQFIFDRGIIDVVVDLMVDTRWEAFLSGPIFKVLIRLLPPDTHLFVLTAPQEVIHARRPDTRHDRNFEIRVRFYELLQQRYDYIHLIKTDETLESSIRQVVDVVLSREGREKCFQ